MTLVSAFTGVVAMTLLTHSLYLVVQFVNVGRLVLVATIFV
jgi:hypothetical protein